MKEPVGPGDSDEGEGGQDAYMRILQIMLAAQVLHNGGRQELGEADPVPMGSQVRNPHSNQPFGPYIRSRTRF